jgi:hypothetical protein
VKLPTSTRLAWLLGIMAVALTLAALLLFVLNRSLYGWPTQHAHLIGQGLYLSGPLIYAALGVLIAVRQRHNPIGWLLLGGALSQAVEGFAEGYALFTLATNPGALPGGALSGWIALWAWAPAIIWFSRLMLLFPTGRLLSHRWRPIAWIVVAFGLLCIVLAALAPGIITSTDDVAVRFVNPLAVTDNEAFFYRFFIPLWVIGFPVLLLAVAIPVIIRFRRAQGQERQQLKWFASAMLWAFVANSFGSYFLGEWSQAISNLAFYGVVGAVGLAILRYRLYDIDIIIRRTLQYSVLSVVLALLYFGSVVLLQTLFRNVVGLGQNQLATVFSTLAIAALFKPLRLRVQSGIDRRFYRRKYDSEQVLAAFAATCRNEVNLEHLTDEFLHVVQGTLQPARVALWLRTEQRNKRDIEVN